MKLLKAQQAMADAAQTWQELTAAADEARDALIAASDVVYHLHCEIIEEYELMHHVKPCHYDGEWFNEWGWETHHACPRPVGGAAQHNRRPGYSPAVSPFRPSTRSCHWLGHP